MSTQDCSLIQEEHNRSFKPINCGRKCNRIVLERQSVPLQTFYNICANLPKTKFIK